MACELRKPQDKTKLCENIPKILIFLLIMPTDFFQALDIRM